MKRLGCLTIATRLERNGFQLNTSQESDIQIFCMEKRKGTSFYNVYIYIKITLKLDDQTDDFLSASRIA